MYYKLSRSRPGTRGQPHGPTARNASSAKSAVARRLMSKSAEEVAEVMVVWRLLPCVRVVENKHSTRYRSMAYFQGKCFSIRRRVRRRRRRRRKRRRRRMKRRRKGDKEEEAEEQEEEEAGEGEEEEEEEKEEQKEKEEEEEGNEEEEIRRQSSPCSH